MKRRVHPTNLTMAMGGTMVLAGLAMLFFQSTIHFHISIAVIAFGVILHFVGKAEADKEAKHEVEEELSTPILETVRVHLKGAVGMTQICIDRRSGSKFAPHDSSLRVVYKATPRVLDDKSILRVHFEPIDKGSVRILGQIYDITHDDLWF